MPTNAASPTLSANDEITRLAVAAKGGDAKACDALLRALPSRLMGLVLAELKLRGRSLPAYELDDIVQDLLVATWQQDLPRFDRERGSFLGFLRRRVAWRVGDSVRAWARCRTTELPKLHEDGYELESEGACPEEGLKGAARELRLLVLPGALAQSLARCEDTAAARAVRAHDLEGHPLREVAVELGVHTSNACRARQRGLRWLAANLPPALREAA